MTCSARISRPSAFRCRREAANGGRDALSALSMARWRDERSPAPRKCGTADLSRGRSLCLPAFARRDGCRVDGYDDGWADDGARLAIGEIRDYGVEPGMRPASVLARNSGGAAWLLLSDRVSPLGRAGRRRRGRLASPATSSSPASRLSHGCLLRVASEGARRRVPARSLTPAGCAMRVTLLLRLEPWLKDDDCGLHRAARGVGIEVLVDLSPLGP